MGIAVARISTTRFCFSSSTELAIAMPKMIAAM